MRELFDVIASSEAHDELKETVTWYEDKKYGLGKEFYLAYKQVRQKIEYQPETNRQILPGIHRTFFPKSFPFIAPK